MRGSYTLSKAKDDAGNAFFFSPQDAARPQDEWGRADNDQRHRVVFSGVVDVPRGGRGWRRLASGMQLGWVWSYASALPFNVLTGTGYLPIDAAECPVSAVDDYNDYILDVVSNAVTGIGCKQEPVDHLWSVP